MKKFTALLIAVVLTVALFAIPGNAASVTVQWFDVEQTEGDLINIVGWCIIDGDDIADFGYRIDNNDPIFSSLQERSAEIVSVMGSDPAKTNGFNVNVPASAIPSGEHVLHIVVKTKGGECLDVNKEGEDGFKVTGTGSASEPAPAELFNKSWDNIFVDGEQLTNGNSDAWIADNEIKGEISEIGFRGWAYISTKLTGFGYSIDGGKVVKSADFIEQRDDVVSNIHADANGFHFNVDVSNIGVGDHTIKIFAIDTSGNAVDTTFECTFTQEREPTGEPVNPGTADAAVIAVAAVACIALAGVVIAKKVK